MRPEQQRHHFRVAGEWPVVCHRITTEGLLGQPFAGTTVDVSAGGVLMVTDELLYRPTKIAMLLDMVEPRLVVRGTIVRAGGRNGRHLCAMRFDNADAATIFKITRFVFRETKQRGQAASRVQPSRQDWWRKRTPGDQVSDAENAAG